MNGRDVEKPHVFLVVLLSIMAAAEKGDSSAGNDKEPATTTPTFAWKCSEGSCVKTSFGDRDVASLAECKITCLPHAGLWPKPTICDEISRNLTTLNATYIQVKQLQKTPIGPLMNGATKRFLRWFHRLEKKAGLRRRGLVLNVAFNISDVNGARLTLQTDEGYELSIATRSNKVSVTITAVSFFGARHGLETLGQLIVHSDTSRSVKVVSDAMIKDCPAYPYRGVMLDTARHYISIRGIERTIEGMALSKLNTFHWHITDSQSFPYVSKSNAGLSRMGAYSPEKVYTSKDIKALVRFALVRGVRIVPEFDAPAHVGEGWQKSGTVINCDRTTAQGCHAQLNPTLTKTYDTLEDLYKDIIDDFDPEIFHMGGDEVSFSCWTADENVSDWMINRSWPSTEEYTVKLWGYFQRNALERYQRHQRKRDVPIVLWNGIQTKTGYIDNLPQERYIIQVWDSKDGEERELVDRGYRIILSNVAPFYLDCGFDYHCREYKTWDQIYNYRASFVVHRKGAREKHIMGAEVTVWTEKIDEPYLDSRIWPRASAMAEVFWSEPELTSAEVKHRFLYHRERLVQAGLGAEAIETEWCVQNDGACVDDYRRTRRLPNSFRYDLRL